jgi:hypothetical protein
MAVFIGAIKIGSREERIAEIKRLMVLSEIALEKVEFNHNGTRVTNPMQQAAATRLLNKAYKLQGDLLPWDMIKIHREAGEEAKVIINKNK